MILTIIIIILLIVFMITVAIVYNKLVRNKNMAMDAWSNIDAALKRRHDLIPNLVNSVRGYAAHEQQTFENVVAARNTALHIQPGDVAGKQAAELGLTQSLRQLFALVENYPELRANTNFLQLQSSLNEIEQNLESSRRYYNATVRDNNAYLQSIPAVFIAGNLGFKPFDFFQAEESDRQNVQVQF